MAYFTYTQDSEHYPDEWEALLNHIKDGWSQQVSAHLGDLAHHIEAKALYVFTMSRHLIEKTESLPAAGNWKPVFVEASILLYPMLELVGEARLGNEPHTGSWRRLASGIDWLIEPSVFPTKSSERRDDFSTDDDRVSTLGNHMETLPSGPRVKELYHLRNYFIHGLKNQDDPNFDIGAVQTSMNYELPRAIVEQAKVGLAVYWRQLQNVDGTAPQDWVVRLAEAKIYPFGIMGASIYEKGLVDPDIVYWLSSLQAAA
jgi:hypothetical protein